MGCFYQNLDHISIRKLSSLTGSWPFSIMLDSFQFNHEEEREEGCFFQIHILWEVKELQVYGTVIFHSLLSTMEIKLQLFFSSESGPESVFFQYCCCCCCCWFLLFQRQKMGTEMTIEDASFKEPIPVLTHPE